MVPKRKAIAGAAATLIASGASAADLTAAHETHEVVCPARAPCPMKKPAGIGGWELLTKKVTLEERADGQWLADFSQLKPAADGKVAMLVLAADGRVVEVRARVPKETAVKSPKTKK